MRDYINEIWALYSKRKRLERLRTECKRALKDYLNKHAIAKLQIGTGPNRLGGWFNTDISPEKEGVYHLDVSEEFPFADNSFDYVFSEHVIEHFTYDQGIEILRQCYRVMRSGGKIRVVTPHIDKIISLRNNKKTELQSRYIRWHITNFFPGKPEDAEIFVINNAFSGFGHRFLYDYETLSGSLMKAGFSDVIQTPYGISSDGHLNGIDWRAKDEMTSYTGLCVEAKKA